MIKRLKDKRGSGYIDIAVIVLSAILVIALATSVFPVYIAKSQLDSFTQELCREAEICGKVGSETSNRELTLKERLGISPNVEWSKSGAIQLNEEFTVTATLEYDIGFGAFASFPIKLTSKAIGKSEVYHK